MTGLFLARGAPALLSLLQSAAAAAAPGSGGDQCDRRRQHPEAADYTQTVGHGFELVVSAAGTAVIDPISGTLSTTGLVTAVGPAARAAVFTTTGSKTSNVHIRIPQNPITLTRVGGAQTMSVSAWTLDGNPNRKIPQNSAFNFAVGATLTVPAGQADGVYLGTFDVTVQYP